MANAIMVSARPRPFYRAMSKPDLSRLILVATTSVVALVLLVWILLWIFFSRPLGGVATGWFAHLGKTTPVLVNQADDALAIGDRFLPESATDHRGLEAALRKLLEGRGDEPVIVYLSAPGVVEGQRAYLLPPADGTLSVIAPPDATTSQASMGNLLDLLGNYPAKKKLLILDAGQVGTDRNLGIFNNSFLSKLTSLARDRKIKNLAILSSCAPGQTSWTSEADQRSVFGYFVAQGLDGKAAGWGGSRRGLDVQGLARYVADHVSQWVWAHRQAIQTPVLLGDPEVNFALHRAAPSRSEAGPPDDPKVLEAASKRLQDGWAERDQLAKLRPYRHAPLLWRRHQETLRHAERLIRAGHLDEGLVELDSLKALKSKLTVRAGGLPIGRAWSLAVGDRALADRPDADGQARLAAAGKAIDDALGRLTTLTNPEAETPDEKAEPARRPASEHVEGQLIDWAATFTGRDGAPDFRGDRGKLLARAVQVRRDAERAAASDERIGRWIVGPVEAGDKRRREAQDLLFVGEDGATDTSLRLLEEAEGLYRQALDDANRCSRALDLVERIEAELPYYGEWKARRDGRRGGAPDLDFEAWLDAAAVLAGQVHAPIDDQAKVRDRINAMDRSYREVGAGFDRLVDEFRTACDQLATSAGPGQWRDVDEALGVPMIQAETRALLFKQAQSLSAPLADARATSGNSSSAVPDPAFGRQAIGLARLERGLLAIAGAQDRELARLAEDYEPARREALKGDPGEASEAFSALVRRVRLELIGRIRAQAGSSASAPAPADPADRGLAAADRAARALPLADVLMLPDDAVAEKLDRSHRQALMLWHGRRLLLDFAPEAALALFEEAGRVLETDALHAATEEARTMARAKLRVRTNPAKLLKVVGNDENRVKVSLEAEKPIPDGRAIASIGYDPALPLTVAVVESGRGAREGAPIDVRPASQEDAVDFSLARGFSDDPIESTLEPVVFYRGRYLKAESPLKVVLDAITGPLAVEIKQGPHRPVKIPFPDQFTKHPGEGYFHFRAPMTYKLAFTNKTDKPLPIWVSYGLEGMEPQTAQRRLAAGQKDESIIGEVSYDDVPVGKPRNLVVVVRKDDEKGVPLATPLVCKFFQVMAKDYIDHAESFDPTRNVFIVTLRRRSSDGVTGPIPVSMEVLGQRQEGTLIRPGSQQRFEFPVNTRVNFIPFAINIEEERPFAQGQFGGGPGVLVPPQPNPQQPQANPPPTPAGLPAPAGLPPTPANPPPMY